MNNTRKLAVLFAVASAAVLAVACSGSICDRQESVGKTLEERGRACQSGGDGGSTIDPNAKKRCESAMSKCTADDQKIMNDQLSCLEKVSTCVKGNELAWAGEILACSKDYQKISSACLAALSGSADGG